jgi:hypothetical protein
MVWISIHPTESGREVAHEITITWGPWIYKADNIIMPNGIILTTGKSPDASDATTMNVQCDHDIYVRFGEGENIEGGKRVVDIKNDWLMNDYSADATGIDFQPINKRNSEPAEIPLEGSSSNMI